MHARTTARLTRLSWQYGLLGLIALVLGVGLLYPIYLTVRGGFAEQVATGHGWTLRHLGDVFRDPKLVDGLKNSASLAVTTTIFATLIALPLAVLTAGYSFPLKKFFNAIILVPMILPPFVGAIGVQAILGREGALNALLGTHFDLLGGAKFWGVVALQSFSLYPIIYLNASAALANLDPAMDEAAQSLGAGWWRRFTRITLPMIRPGLFAGATIVFIWSFTELGTPLMFEYSTVTPVQIFQGLKEVESSAEPYALTFVLLMSAILIYTVGRLTLGASGTATTMRASRAGGERELGPVGRWVATGAFVAVSSLAVIPHLGVVLKSVATPGQWYGTVLPTSYTGAHFGQALSAAESFGSIVNSLKLAAAATAVDVVLGVMIGYLLVRTNVRGRGMLDALCMLPLAVPGLVMAFGYVAMSLHWPFGKGDPLEGWVSVIGTTPNPVPLLIIAYSVRRLPYIVRSTVAGLQQTSGELEEAAINLGASRLTAVRRIILPLIAANLIAGGLLVFSFSMLEVSDSLLLAQQPKDFPFTRAIFAFMERLGDGPSIASAMGVWGMALLTVTLFTASSLLGKKMGSLFRV